MKIKAFENSGKYYVNVNDLQKFLNQEKYKNLLINENLNFSFYMVRQLSFIISEQKTKCYDSLYMNYVNNEVYVNYSVLTYFYETLYKRSGLIADLIDFPWMTNFIDLKILKFN